MMLSSTSSLIASSQEAEYWFPYHYISKMPRTGFAQHFVDTWGINYISTIEFMLRKIAESAPQSIIDIGCGDGRLAREIHLNFSGMKIRGVDYSARAINLAKAMNQDAPTLDYEQLDILRSEFAETYDAAILMEVFEHIPLDQAEDFLAGVRSAVKPGGILFLTVPHANKPVEYKHFQHFTVDSITRYLSPHFDVTEVTPFEKKGPARRVINALLCNRLFVLNSHTLLRVIYEFHQKYLFYCAIEEQCQRLFVKAVAK
jgi:cyclopropane fatty-acyl-phospholipid synthase-like methyltransferase